jgi:hypothetical protein
MPSGKHIMHGWFLFLVLLCGDVWVPFARLSALPFVSVSGGCGHCCPSCPCYGIRGLCPSANLVARLGPVGTHWVKISTIPPPRVSPGTSRYPKGLQVPKTNRGHYSHHNHHTIPPSQIMRAKQIGGSPTLVEPLSPGPGRATRMALGHNCHIP